MRNKIKWIVSKIKTAAPFLYFSTRGTAVKILKGLEPAPSLFKILAIPSINPRYWKNMYGYRLCADDDAPQVYYNVQFRNGPILSYPEWTVR